MLARTIAKAVIAGDIPQAGEIESYDGRPRPSLPEDFHTDGRRHPSYDNALLPQHTGRCMFGDVGDHIEGGLFDRFFPLLRQEAVFVFFAADGEDDAARAIDQCPRSIGMKGTRHIYRGSALAAVSRDQEWDWVSCCGWVAPTTAPILPAFSEAIAVPIARRSTTSATHSLTDCPSVRRS
jgi:hypothetical protein